MFEWQTNGTGLLNDLISIAAWIGIWGCAESSIDYITSNRLHRLLIYAVMSLLAILTLLIFGSPYYGTKDKPK